MSLNYLNARVMAAQFHAGQKYGEDDYFQYHICGVVSSLEDCGYGDKHSIVAFLHDILEDTDCTPDQIKDAFGDEILDAVIALTKEFYGAESRNEYLKRVAKNEIARDVKIHDILFNLANCHKERRFGKLSYYNSNIKTLSDYIKEEIK